jgi:putative transposase
MARPLRTVAPGVPLHIVQRGNNRAACFFDQEDFECYLRFLLRAAGEEHCRVHAYCLMSNHVHLLITPEDHAACARFMKVVNQRYAQHVNRLRERTGTPWEGRYRSSVVSSMRYVLACYRYIELNPVRAGIVRHPRDYPWSSYPANAEGFANPLVSVHGCYAALGRDPATRRRAYRALVDETLGAQLIDNIRTAIGSGRPLRDDPYRDSAELSTGV